MKKVFSLLIGALLVYSCTSKVELGTPFQAGQQVSLIAHMPNTNSGASQLPSKQRVSGLDAGTHINLTWDEGDVVLVTVDGQTAEFTLESGAGSSTGTFTGTMPANGMTYSVQYPVSEPDLSNQTYVENGFGKGLLKLMTTNGTIDDGFTLAAQHSLFGLQLTGNTTVRKIVLTNLENDETYTLNYAMGVTITSAVKLFYFVVPAGEWTAGLKVDVYASEDVKLAEFSTSNCIAMSSGKATIMPEKEVAHDYVDLGLSVKWATCNVGATKPEEYGNHFAWGETQPKSIYDLSTYKWSEDGTAYTLTKYNTGNTFGMIIDDKTQLELIDDAAAANWGGNWRMPTTEEQKELYEHCTWTWTTINGVNGYEITSKKSGYTSKSIFLPAAGYRSGGSLNFVGVCGDYWSSSLSPDFTIQAYYMGLRDGVWHGCDVRSLGLSVRPVVENISYTGISETEGTLPTIEVLSIVW